jgi:hypothetical protein
MSSFWPNVQRRGTESDAGVLFHPERRLRYGDHAVRAFGSATTDMIFEG